MMDRQNSCPCCGTVTLHDEESSFQIASCEICGHRWRTGPLANQAEYYSQQMDRNALPSRYIERRLVDRLNDVLPLINDGMRLLEVGCAEGEFGLRIKSSRQVDYQGVEPSQDSIVAAGNLDRVFSYTSELCASTDGGFDGIISFHVLEHIQDAAAEICRWRSLLANKGWLVLDVPHGTGHPDIEEDCNPEHLHQFSSASIACLLARSGFQIDWLDRGHFASPTYTDSIRVFASLAPSANMRRERLIARFRKCLPSPFVIYGVGGDFLNYISPILASLAVQAVLDSNPGRLGEKVMGMAIESYNPERHASLPILIASLRYEESILSALQAIGHPQDKIYLLGDVLDDGCACLQ